MYIVNVRQYNRVLTEIYHRVFSLHSSKYLGTFNLHKTAVHPSLKQLLCSRNINKLHFLFYHPSDHLTFLHIFRKFWIYFVSKVNDNIVEYLRMHVPAELHHDEPVSEPKSGHDNNNILPTTGLGTGTKLHDTEVSRNVEIL